MCTCTHSHANTHTHTLTHTHMHTHTHTHTHAHAHAQARTDFFSSLHIAGAYFAITRSCFCSDFLGARRRRGLGARRRCATRRCCRVSSWQVQT